LDFASVLLLLLASWGWGELVAPVAGRQPESRFLRFVVGVVAVSHLTVLLGALGALRPALVLGVVYGGAALGTARSWAGRTRSDIVPATASARMPAAALALLAVLTLLSLLRGLERDRGADPYHAFLPKAYLLAQGSRPFPGVAESTYPMSWEMLSVVPYSHGTGGQPALLSAFAFGLAALGAALCLRSDGPVGAAVAGIAVATNPLLVRTAGTSHIECGQALLVTGGILGLLRFRSRGEPGALLAAAAILGALFGTKETAAPLVLLPAAAVLLWPERTRSVPLSRTVVLGAIALVLAPSAYWTIRKTSATGNPFYPAASDRVPTAAAFLSGAERFREIHPDADGLPYAERLARLIPSLALDGVAEPLFGVAGVLLLASRAARARHGPLLAAAACALAVSPFALGGQSRFHAPAMPLFGLAAGALAASAVSWLRVRSPRSAALATALVVGLLLVRFPLHFLALYDDPSDLFRIPPVSFEARARRNLEVDPQGETLLEANRRFGEADRLLVVSSPRHLEFLSVPFVPPSHFVPDLRPALRRAGIDPAADLGVTGVLVLDGADANAARTASDRRGGAGRLAILGRGRP